MMMMMDVLDGCGGDGLWRPTQCATQAPTIRTTAYFLRVAMTKKAGCSGFYEKRNRTANVEDTLISTIRTVCRGLNKRGLVLRVGEARGF